jgi:hypothetical protein
MEKQIKKISLDDYNHLGFTFTESEIEKFKLLEKDKLIIDEDQFLKEVK